MAKGNVIWFGHHVYGKFKTNNAKALTITGAYASGVCKVLAPVDTGLLRSSITYATALERGQATREKGTQATEKDMIEKPDDDAKLKIGTAVEYAPHVEFGTKAHYPPPSALKGWAKRVLGDAGLAYAVAKAMSRKKRKAQSFLRVGILGNKRGIGRVYSQAIKGLMNKNG